MPQTLQPQSDVVGLSREGRPIEIHYFGLPEHEALDTLFLGVFHGDEGIAGELLLRFKEAFMKGEFALPSQNRFAILPVLNPDGLQSMSRVNAAGVDLNRNYPTQDWQEENQGTPYYSGPAAASEPETRIILKLLEKHRPQKIITVHSPYRVINYDGPGRELADAMAAHSGYEVVESIGYPTPGSFGTYVGKERSIPTITLELPEDKPLETVWQENKNALLAALRYPNAMLD